MPRPPSRSRTHRSLANTFIIETGSPPPFRRVGHLDGVAAYTIATEHGMVAATSAGVALHSHDLATVRWRMPLPKGPEMVSFEDTLCLGAIDRHILVVDTPSGKLVSRVPCEGGGQVSAVTAYGALVSAREAVTLVDLDSGRQVWSWPCKYPFVACDDQAAYLRLGHSDEIACVDLVTGESRWLFRAEPEGKGDPTRSHIVDDYGVVADAVVVVTRAGRVYRLDKTTGRPIATGIPKASGIPLVTPNSVLFLRTDALLDFRLSDMTDAEPVDLTGAATLHKPFAGTASYAVSEQAIIWTTTRGGVRAVSRRDPTVSWRDDLSGVLFSVGQHPVVWNDYVYVEPVGGDVSLVAYRAQ